MILDTASRNTLATALAGLPDAGAGAGYLEILTAGDAVLATITLKDPAFGSPSTGAVVLVGGDGSTPISASNVLSATATGTGTAAKYSVYDSTGTRKWRGTVGVGLTIDNAAIVTGQTVQLTGGTFTVPAGTS